MADPREAAVGATRRTLTRPRHGSRRLLRELPWLAAGLGSLAVRDASGQSFADAKFLFYKESGGRTQVLNPVVLYRPDLGQNHGELSLLLGYDSITGASPTGEYPTSDVTTSASGKLVNAGSVPQAEYSDARKSGSLTYQRKFGAHLPSVDISYASENDYVARGGRISDSWTMAGGRGTVNLGIAISRDLVQPVKNPTTNPDGKDLSFDKSENGFSLGWTWVLGERDLIDVSGSLMRLSGYLDDPYKVVPVGPDASINAPEHRPDTRSRRAFLVKYAHHYLWDGAIKFNYRYYNDDWGINAHTIEVTYDQRVASDWIVTPQVRFYTQTAANFYASRLPAPREFMSADYRLSPLDSILGGLTLSYRINDALTVSLGGTWQTQTGRDRVTPIQKTPNAGAAPTVSAADMNVLAITAGIARSF